ncbi:Nramp family divalent metal transporter [Shewanella ulleungensis]|jgi:NRAMP (natural resistance-associated macrophage protein)-like metal ion transporter|uniref:Manganese transporter n=1 Tax=Shewanella ulleungensis TaxID=2282699 RepID=A0ABQ2QXG1_9GAMM|nr:Nramp family divalent metal transporter [Shewanella ulleungensis]MCL1151923.1 Nramp family divalent metal transporter [Shewanella ulleungensis]GGP97989.1 manganese transporter [Shewanella ulleungensis]
MFAKLKKIGPGVVVTAAFIGPGTITACTLAGAKFGYSLLWALGFATIATIILQEMSARLGVITQKGLGEVLWDALQHSIFKWPLFLLIMVALYIGNAAYEGGNLAGAALGIQAIVGESESIYQLSILTLSLIGALILWRGSYKQIERILIFLVLLMGVSFVVTFFVVKPELLSIVNGLMSPNITTANLLTVIALIGTTVVPYNLFLHASAAKSHWQGAQQLGEARVDTAISIGLGGIIALLIVSTAAASMFAHGLAVNGAADMAKQFEPLFGVHSKYLLGMGMFAAGLSSVITAPLATSYAISEILRVEKGTESTVFRGISLSILLIGACLALTGINPIEIIVLAQFANGLLLPIVASFLLFAINHKKLLGQYANGWLSNSLGGCVVIFTTFLGVRMVADSIGLSLFTP